MLSKEKTLSVPATLLKRFYEMATSFSDLSDELEDFLLSRDRDTVKALKQARKEHLQGKVKPLSAYYSLSH